MIQEIIAHHQDLRRKNNVFSFQVNIFLREKSGRIRYGEVTPVITKIFPKALNTTR